MFEDEREQSSGFFGRLLSRIGSGIIDWKMKGIEDPIAEDEFDERDADLQAAAKKRKFFWRLFLICLLIAGAFGARHLYIANLPPPGFTEALELYGKNDFEGAIVPLKHVLETDPQNMEARFMLAHSYLEIDLPASAEKELLLYRKALPFERKWVEPLFKAWLQQRSFKKIIETVATFKNTELSDLSYAPEIRNYQAKALLGIKDVDAAEAIFIEQSNTSSKDEDSIMAWLGLARVAKERRDSDAAEDYINRVLIRSPDNHEALLLLAELQHYNGLREAAKDTYAQILKTDPENIEALLGSASNMIHLGNLKQASDYLKVVEKDHPTHPVLLYLTALVSAKQEDYTSAYKLLQASISQMYNMPQALVLLGDIAMKKEDYLLAISTYKRYLETREDVQIALKLAHLYIKQQNPLPVLNLLEPYAKSADMKVITTLGHAQQLAGNHKAAIDYFTQTIMQAPDQTGPRVLMATSLLQLNESAAAITQLKEELTLNPEYFDAQRLLVVAYINSGELDLAHEAALSFRRNHPKSEEPLTLLGEIASKQDKKAQADDYFSQALNINPEAEGAKYTRAKDLFKNKDYETSKQLFAELYRDDPENMHALAGLVDIAMAQNQGEEVIRLLKHAHITLPGKTRPGRLLVRQYLANHMVKEAYDIGRELLARDPQHPDVLYISGLSFMHASDVERARTALGALEKMHPTSPIVYYLEAENEVIAKDLDAAKDNYVKALKFNPNFIAARTGLIELEVMRGRPVNALKQLDALPDNLKRTAQAQILYGKAYMATQRYEDASKAYNTALLEGPNREATSQLMEAQILAGNARVAMLTAERWISQNPSDIEMRLRLAQLYNDNGSSQAAIRSLTDVLDYDNKNLSALLALSKLLEEQRPQQAFDYATRAYRINSKHPQAISQYGWTASNNGFLNDGHSALEKGFLHHPEDPDIIYYLARVELRKGNKTKAKNLLYRLLNNHKGYEHIKDAEKLNRSL